jgi:hypothetical protein
VPVAREGGCDEQIRLPVVIEIGGPDIGESDASGLRSPNAPDFTGMIAAFETQSVFIGERLRKSEIGEFSMVVEPFAEVPDFIDIFHRKSGLSDRKARGEEREEQAHLLYGIRGLFIHPKNKA